MTAARDDLPAHYGSKFFVDGVPEDEFPEDGMSARDAYELIGRRARSRRRPVPQPGDLRDHVDGAGGAA